MCVLLWDGIFVGTFIGPRGDVPSLSCWGNVRLEIQFGFRARTGVRLELE